MTAGTGLFGARLWRLTAGRRARAAFGCGKAGVGCRRAANPAKSGNEGNCRSANVIGGVGEDGAKG
ncbi:MAG: hypothetical protein JNJ78_06610 [Anaerolineae bacterium]|nr:hypothetical protein [Anaerolineae bacterium]